MMDYNLVKTAQDTSDKEWLNNIVQGLEPCEDNIELLLAVIQNPSTSDDTISEIFEAGWPFFEVVQAIAVGISEEYDIIRMFEILKRNEYNWNEQEWENVRATLRCNLIKLINSFSNIDSNFLSWIDELRYSSNEAEELWDPDDIDEEEDYDKMIYRDSGTHRISDDVDE